MTGVCQLEPRSSPGSKACGSEWKVAARRPIRLTPPSGCRRIWLRPHYCGVFEHLIRRSWRSHPHSLPDWLSSVTTQLPPFSTRSSPIGFPIEAIADLTFNYCCVSFVVLSFQVYVFSGVSLWTEINTDTGFKRLCGRRSFRFKNAVLKRKRSSMDDGCVFSANTNQESMCSR